MPLQKLSPTTSRRLSSSQVISSVFSAVKELVENALDSGANTIDIKLVNFGLDKIEVQDDGCGVPISNVQHMCLPHYTSKIKEFSDLGTKLETYGFRGEALSSLCNIANVTITTRTADDEYASVFTFDEQGKVMDDQTSHFNKGTTVTVLNIFNNMPVRKQFMSASNKPKAELQKTAMMVKNLAIINPGVCFSFCHNKCIVWQKSRAQSLKDSAKSVLGYSVISQLEEISTVHKKNSVVLLLPKRYCKEIAVLCSTSVDVIRIFINQRPVHYKKLQKIVMKCVAEHFGNNYPKGKYPTCIVSIQIAPCDVDVNLEPNKTKVICHEEDGLLTVVEKLFESFYKSTEKENCVKKPRLDLFMEQPATSIGLCREQELLTEQSLTMGKEQTNIALENPLLSVDHEVLVEEFSAEDKNLMNNLKEQPALPVAGSEELQAPAEVDMNMWSRGYIKSTCGDVIEGGAAVLVPQNNTSRRESVKEIAQISSEKSNSNVKMNKKDIACVKKFNSSFHSVSSQMGCKNMTGFTNFCREMRPKILLENPGMCFTEVARILSHKWKSVSSEGQNDFTTNTKNVKLVPARAMSTREQQNNSILNMFKKTAQNMNQTTSRKFPSWYQPVPKNAKDSSKTSCVTWNISVNEWKTMSQPKINNWKSKDTSSRSAETDLLHQLLPSGTWICKHGPKIGIIRHQHLQEKLYFKQLMRSHYVPVIPLDKPLLIKQEEFDPELWQCLQFMKTESICPNTFEVICPLLSKNGFKLVWKNEELYLTHVASTIRFYGKAELYETLQLMRSSSDPSQCRPVKVVAYLESEAVRLCGQKQSTMDRDKLTKLLEFCDILNDLCFHQKPIFQLLFTLPQEEYRT